MVIRTGALTKVILTATALAAVAACGSDDGASRPGDDLRLNHMQVVGTHNSYHIRPREPLFSLLVDFAQVLADSFDYTHIPLQEQFESQGVRQIELDIFYDPNGGLYESPVGLQIALGDPLVVIPGLDLPGFKVLHVQEVDFETTCTTLIDCLVEVKTWSDEHPHHVPITILIEAKDDAIDLDIARELGFLIPPPIGTEELDLLDDEIRSVFPPEQLITPDDVRGSEATLRDAVLTTGWPRLNDARGRVLFALDNGGRKRDDYVEGHPSLSGRILFTSSEDTNKDEAAFFKMNNAIGSFDDIQERVGQGFIVRTRADSPPDGNSGGEARDGDTMRRDIALASGAQFVSTDYPVPNPELGTGYQVQMPGGMPVRCNPVNSPTSCEATLLENPDQL